MDVIEFVWKTYNLHNYFSSHVCLSSVRQFVQFHGIKIYRQKDITYSDLLNSGSPTIINCWSFFLGILSYQEGYIVITGDFF